MCADNSIHFRHTNRCSCETVKVFETKNVSTWGGLEPPTFGFMPNAVTYWAIRARHLLTYVFEHWLWRYRYFCSKVNIWYVNCARATAFIFDTRTGVLVKVSWMIDYSWVAGQVFLDVMTLLWHHCNDKLFSDQQTWPWLKNWQFDLTKRCTRQLLFYWWCHIIQPSNLPCITHMDQFHTHH